MKTADVTKCSLEALCYYLNALHLSHKQFLPECHAFLSPYTPAQPLLVK